MARRTRSVGSRDDHVEFSASRSIFRKYAGESAEGRSHWDLMRGFSGTVAVHQRTYICNAQPGATRCEMIDDFTSGARSDCDESWNHHRDEARLVRSAAGLFRAGAMLVGGEDAIQAVPRSQCGAASRHPGDWPQ